MKRVRIRKKKKRIRKKSNLEKSLDILLPKKKRIKKIIEVVYNQYCKKHKRHYANYLKECAICVGEKMKIK